MLKIIFFLRKYYLRGTGYNIMDYGHKYIM